MGISKGGSGQSVTGFVNRPREGQILERGKFLFHIFLHGIHKVFGIQIHAFFYVLESVNTTRQILGHVAIVNTVHTSTFQGQAEPKREQFVVNIAFIVFESDNTHFSRSLLPSSLARWDNPRVQAKILAMGLVDVFSPF